jgi:hypothetical protein
VVASASASDVEAVASEPRENESELAAHVRAIVERVVGAIGAGARVDVEETDDELFVTAAAEIPAC